MFLFCKHRLCWYTRELEGGRRHSRVSSAKFNYTNEEDNNVRRYLKTCDRFSACHTQRIEDFRASHGTLTISHRPTLNPRPSAFFIRFENAARNSVSESQISPLLEQVANSRPPDSHLDKGDHKPGEQIVKVSTKFSAENLSRREDRSCLEDKRGSPTLDISARGWFALADSPGFVYGAVTLEGGR